MMVTRHYARGEPLFRRAEAARAAVDAFILARRLVEQAVDDHDVLKHYRSGADLVDDFADKDRRLPPDATPSLGSIVGPCAARERCRLRRLGVRSAYAGTPARK